MHLDDTSPDGRRLLALLATSASQPIPKKSQQIRTDKPRPHACSICTRGFARLEHLKRHERSHTNEKPFQCAACGRCFARRDLVLRHQQKLHLHMFLMTRRGLLPTTLQMPESAGSTPSNENIIILQNNTKAKAPLPQSENLSPSQDAGLLDGLTPPNDQSKLDYDSYVNGTIPSPHTNSCNNTPSFMNSHLVAPSSFSDLGLPGFAQQPSPMTADSPDSREKKKRASVSKRTQDFLEQERYSKSQFQTQRHASFSAVSGLSYTNLKDALAIKNVQIPDGPSQVGFATPQTNTMDKGLVDFGELDSDWYMLDFNGDQKLAGDQRKKDKSSSFQVKLNTIPSESNITSNTSEYFANNILASQQFHNPNHPHHIAGTTPLASGQSPIEGPHGIDFPQYQVGLGFQHLMEDILMLQDLKADSMPEPALRKERKQPQGNEPKRQKLGFINNTENLDWVEQIKSIPIASDFPSASKITGFSAIPYITDAVGKDEVFDLFQLRQDELIRQRSDIDTRLKLTPQMSSMQPISLLRTSSKVMFTIGGETSNDFINDELRNRIVECSRVADDQFPALADLNAYMNSYGEEFNSYFPFIHLPTLKTPMVDNHENIPLILAMCAIGALYSYHDNNTLLLFNLSKYHIHEFFENEVTANKLQLKKVPIMAHQCLVLHIFISMFLNEPNMIEITARQVKSMVGLVKSTNFHRPLECFLTPPAPVSSPNDAVLIQNNYDYFIMAQTRIRTLHMFHQLVVVRHTLLGHEIPFSSLEIESGSYCMDEELWNSNSAAEWFQKYVKMDGKTLVSVSNNHSIQQLAMTLSRHDNTFVKSSSNESFALLNFVHECISKERSKTGQDAVAWRVNSRPPLEALLLSWEAHYVRNGGLLSINEKNLHVLRTLNEAKLVMPLLYLAKIRLCLDYTPVTARLLQKDWAGMGEAIQHWNADPEALKEASRYALEVLDLWTYNIADMTAIHAVRTPVYFVTAIFISIAIISKSLQAIEHAAPLLITDKVFWIRCEQSLRKIEKTLTSNEESLYSEFLRNQTHGIFDYAQSRECKSFIETLCILGDWANTTLEQLRRCKLLTQVLGLGVRILADAPLWPLCMGFAEALKNTALQ